MFRLKTFPSLFLFLESILFASIEDYGDFVITRLFR